MEAALLSKPVSSSALIAGASAFLLLFTNFRFSANILQQYPLTLENSLFLVSLGVLLFCVNTILLSLACYKSTLKPVIILCLLLAASTAYFMDTYNVIIDDVMIDNIARTDHGEVGDLLSLRLFIYVLALGILPALIVWRTPVKTETWLRTGLHRLQLITFSVTVAAVVLFSFSDNYATFFREHKLLRYYANPTYIVYSVVSYIQQQTATQASGAIMPIALDAMHQPDSGSRKLIVFVVGETARADHFFLNGYERNTNPQLSKVELTTFTNVWSCGTSTAVSLPCMFSPYTREQYQYDKIQSTENVLDVLLRVGINVVWLDNNSDSKGVALRIPYENYKTDEMNEVCDVECRDTGMLDYIDAFVALHPTGDMFLVLHQMGNHGPAYNLRYPPEFEQFVPTCQTKILEHCSIDEIVNSYDNALLYTDHFLNAAIERLKTHSDKFATAMIYIGDHGESLGEFGLYLHGLPFALAPDTQKQVPLIMWFNERFKAEAPEVTRLAATSAAEYSHDNIFHTILGLTDVTTSLYEPAMDIID
ncbi:MAG: phosphoethanolamine--lipid A transferase [Pseudohongiellaceae bacterium]